MDRGIVKMCLNVVMHASAILCTVRSKNKIFNIILECIYCMIIFILPTFIVVLFLSAFAQKDALFVESTFKCISYIIGGSFLYFVIANRKNKKKIEDYFLLGSLYVMHYITNKKRLKKQWMKIGLEVITFVVMYIFFLVIVEYFLMMFVGISYTTIRVGLIISLPLTYTLFVHGKYDKKIIKSRKELLAVICIIWWLVAVCKRMKDYLEQGTAVALGDMTILLFSVVFTIPTIKEWLKRIPSKVVRPYVRDVSVTKKELLRKYVVVQENLKTQGTNFINDIMQIVEWIKCKWKNGEKRKVLKMIIYVIAMIILMFLTWNLSDELHVAMNLLGEKIICFYDGLNSNIQIILEKIMLTTIIVGIMIYFTIGLPRVLRKESKIIKKVNTVFSVIIFETIFIFAIYFIWV